MVGVQHAHLVAGLGIPHVNASIRRATENELRVRAEGRLDRYALVIQMAGERLQRSALERVYQPDNRSIRRYQYRLAILTKFEPRPVALFLLQLLECGKRTLVKGT